VSHRASLDVSTAVLKAVTGWVAPAPAASRIPASAARRHGARSGRRLFDALSGVMLNWRKSPFDCFRPARSRLTRATKWLIDRSEEPSRPPTEDRGTWFLSRFSEGRSPRSGQRMSSPTIVVRVNLRY